VTTAYAVAKALNAFVLSLTAVPAYFLARRFVPSGFSLLVAALVVLLPAMLYAGTLMTEVALFPAFVLALLATTVSVERPRVSAQAAALGAIGVACAIKMLAVVLLPAYALAIVLYHALDTSNSSEWRGRMRRYTPTWLTLVSIASLSVLVAAATGHRPQDALGTYVSVLDHMDLTAVPRWAFYHVAELDLTLAVVPFAATLMVAARGFRRDADPVERLFVSVATPAVVLVLAAVAAFASVPFLELFKYPENIERLQGRNTFVLAPLFFIGLVMWLRKRSARSSLAVLAVTAAVVMPVAIPFGDLSEHVRFQAPALVPWVAMDDDVAPFAVLGFTGALGLLFLLAVRIRASAALFVAPVALVLVTVGSMAHASMRGASVWSKSVAWGATPDWVDAAAEQDDSVSVIWAEPPGEPFVDLRPSQYVVFVGEFFNRSIGQVFELGSPLPYDLPSTPVRLEHRRVLLEDGTPAPVGKLVLAPCHVRVVGTPVARDTSTGAVVYRVRQPIRAEVTSPASCAQPVSSAAP
jgi:hypothetical protein